MPCIISIIYLRYNSASCDLGLRTQEIQYREQMSIPRKRRLEVGYIRGPLCFKLNS